MLADWSTEELQRLNCCCGQLLLQVPRKRGARLRPLGGATRRLERALTLSYRQLFREVVASLRGASDDVVKGRLAQAELTVEEREALRFFSVPEDEGEQEVDRSRLAAILILILLWRNRHVAIAETFIGEMFDLGRGRVLKQLKVPDASALRETAALRDETLARFRSDIDRLQAALTDGSPRSSGIRQVVEASGMLAEAAVALRKLYNSESFRLGLFAEALVWTAYQEGRRAGAIDGTNRQRSNGMTDEEVARFRFTGPLDSHICPSCRGHYGEELIADSVAALPSPYDWCDFGIHCRHHWELVL